MALSDAFLTEDDGLHFPTVGSWAANKHRKIGYYCSLFATSMKKQWDCRVYLDLFAGAGKGRVKETAEIVAGSPLLSLAVQDQFDRYIFCDSDLQSIDALQKRVQKYFPEADCHFVAEDCNSRIQDVIDEVPAFSKSFTGITFCLVDPYNADDLHFDTVKAVANALFVDFLILIPSHMDINRNMGIYLDPGNPTLDKMLGYDTWRQEWPSEQQKRVLFGQFIAERFCLRMKDLGFLYEGPGDMELIRFADDRNQRLYHLAFFSKNKLGLEFWRETLKGTDSQLSLF